ncbi:MAG: hypothetical protein AAGC90_01010 [Curtobacterium sp.]
MKKSNSGTSSPIPTPPYSPPDSVDRTPHCPTPAAIHAWQFRLDENQPRAAQGTGGRPAERSAGPATAATPAGSTTNDGTPPESRPILGGIVGLQRGWTNGFDSSAAKAQLASHNGDAHLDLGLALEHSAFDHVLDSANLEILRPGLEVSSPGTQLIFFALRLFRGLHSVGTAMVIDLRAYDALLEGIDPAEFPENGAD